MATCIVCGSEFHKSRNRKTCSLECSRQHQIEYLSVRRLNSNWRIHQRTYRANRKAQMMGAKIEAAKTLSLRGEDWKEG